MTASRAERQGRQRDLRMGLAISMGITILSLTLIVVVLKGCELRSTPSNNQELVQP